MTLLELYYQDPDIFQQTEVYIDGGITRGTDILKALCLGAKGVLVGRPFLYALNYGEEGIVHLIDSMLRSFLRLVLYVFSNSFPSFAKRTGNCYETCWNHQRFAGTSGAAEHKGH